MPLSRQDIVKLAEKLYERGERPTVITLQENLLETSADKHIPMAEIAHGLRLWRSQRFTEHDTVSSVDKTNIDNHLKKHLEQLHNKLSEQVNSVTTALLEHTTSTLNSSEDEIIALAHKLDQLQKHLHKNTAELTQTNEEKSSLSTLLKETQSELKVIKQQESNLSEIVKTYKDENAELKGRTHELGTLKETLSAQVNTLSSENSLIKNDKINLQNQLSEQKRLSEKHTKEIEDLQTLKHRAELTASKLEQKTTDTLERFTELGKEKDSALVEMDNTKKRLLAEQQEREALAKRLTIAETKSNEMQKETDRLNTTLREMTQELQNKSTELEKATLQLTKDANQAASFQNKIAAEQTTIEQLNQQLSLLKTHNEEINKSRLSQEASINRLESEIKTIKEKFQERQQLWIQEKRELTDRLENERQIANDMRVEVSKHRRTAT